MNRPAWQLLDEPEPGRVRLHGDWRLAHLAGDWPEFQARLQGVLDHAQSWDLSDIHALDSVGALLLWRVWGRRLPEQIVLSAEQRQLFATCAGLPEQLAKHPPQTPPPRWRLWLEQIGLRSLSVGQQFMQALQLLGQVMLDMLHCLRYPQDIPFKEISAHVYKAGVCAMPVAALGAFLIGVALSYLTAFQLRNFGAETFIVNILGLGIIRELGPILVAILVAGRSGSAMTAQLGVMRVTEEIDALAVMGVSRSLRLVFPKVLALSLSLPLLVLWTNAVSLFGGMVTADLQLHISYGFFLENLPRVVPVVNLYLGLVKGVVFGFAIALVACHFGLQVRPNTESLSTNTTASVVTAITVVIFLDAIFAILTRELGLPI